MHKKSVFYINYLSVYITVLTLFFFFGQSLINSAQSANATNTKFSKTVVSINFISPKSFFCERKTDSTVPEESPILIEEQEDDSNDDKNNSCVLLTDWTHYAQKRMPPVASPVNFLICNNRPQFLSVPLYILFRSLKDYLIC
jgi:hypothetical protein